MTGATVTVSVRPARLCGAEERRENEDGVSLDCEAVSRRARASRRDSRVLWQSTASPGECTVRKREGKRGARDEEKATKRELLLRDQRLVLLATDSAAGRGARS